MTVAVIDLETTGTNPDIHEVWELAVAIGNPVENKGPIVDTWNWEPSNLYHADPRAMEINGYHDRPNQHHDPRWVLNKFAGAVRGLRLASCNISFDMLFLHRACSFHDIPVTWHYSPIDVKSFCYGVLPTTFGWSTDDLVNLFCGVEHVRDPGKPHTAMDDAKLAYMLLRDAMIYRNAIQEA